MREVTKAGREDMVVGGNSGAAKAPKGTQLLLDHAPSCCISTVDHTPRGKMKDMIGFCVWVYTS